MPTHKVQCHRIWHKNEERTSVAGKTTLLTRDPGLSKLHTDVRKQCNPSSHFIIRCIMSQADPEVSYLTNEAELDQFHGQLLYILI